MEEDVHQILRRAVSEEDPARSKLGSRIAAHFAGIGLTAPLPELRSHTDEPMGLGE